MSRTKEFLENFQFRYEGTELDALRIKWEEEEMAWYFANESERPYLINNEDYDSSITEQGI